MQHFLTQRAIKHVISLFLFVTLVSCGGGGSEREDGSDSKNANDGANATLDALADPMKIKGVGPVQELTLEPQINQQLAQEGKTIFENYCTACHKVEERYIGPPMAEITTRRSPEWIMNMILNPEVMVKEDPIAKELLREYLSPMANQNLSREQARSILEYFRTLSDVDSLNHQS